METCKLQSSAVKGKEKDKKDKPPPLVSRLFVYTVIDHRDEFEEKYENAFLNLQQITANLSDKELHDILSNLVCKEKQHEEISLGFIYKILTDPVSAGKTYRDLTLLTRDGLMMVTNHLNLLVADKYLRLTEIARRQLMWLVREMVKNQVTNIDGIVWNCLRQASGGDTSQKNLQLVEGLLDILIEHRLWLAKFPFLISCVVYSYVRLIEDHIAPHLTVLRQKETKFVIALIRERFPDVIVLGRDFVRLLQNVARIPEFEQLWKDILQNPKQLSPTFQGVWQLLQTRTSRRFLQCRLTPEIERKVQFLTNHVRFGTQKRYQEWFQEKYFNTAESQSLRCDLIRYIINAIHPSNDMLCSDLIPRWAIIGWLLTTCTNPIAAANVKLAVFYDWLFFDPQKDNIMNVEPGILVMFHSLRSHPLVSSTLLDFLCRIIKSFYPRCEDKIRAGVYNTLRKILEKQVIPNLHPLFESPKLDRELRTQIRETFREFCMGPNDVAYIDPVFHPGGMMMDDSRMPSAGGMPPMFPHMMPTPMHTNNNINDNINPSHLGLGGSISLKLETPDITDNDNETEAQFSDDEEVAEEDGVAVAVSAAASEITATTTTTTTTITNIITKSEETDDDDDLPLSKVRLKEKPTPDKIELPASISDEFGKFVVAKTAASFEVFLAEFKHCTSALDQEQETYLHTNILSIIKSTLPKTGGHIFPESKTDEKALADSIAYPVFSIFKIMYQTDDKCKKCFLSMLKAVGSKMPCLGYMVLYFLKVHTKLQSRKNPQTQFNFKISLYKNLCDSLETKVDVALSTDLALLESESTQMFLWLLPDIYREFKNAMVNNSKVLRILVGCVDAKNLRDLIYSITQGKLTIFKNDGVLECIRESLRYETFEQFCLWQIVQAHDVPMEYLQDILPELESSAHSEALTYMLLLLKNEKPTTELVRQLLSRETKNRGDSFVTSALRYWCGQFEEKLSEIIANLLTSKYPNSSPNKRKRPLKSNSAQNSSPSSDQLLCHLEHFRRSCRHGNGAGTGLYVQDAMQRALQQSFSHSSDSTKKQYSDLFALAAEDETSGVGRRGTSGRGRKPLPNKKDTNSSNANNKKNAELVVNVFTSDEESSDDYSKPRTAKRRKKALSDSD